MDDNLILRKGTQSMTTDQNDIGIGEDGVTTPGRTYHPEGGVGAWIDKPVATLIPNRPDAEVARELRGRMEKAFEPIVEVMDEAIRLGLVVTWGGFTFNPLTGHHSPPPIDVARHF
jgi:hypothetical protein